MNIKRRLEALESADRPSTGLVEIFFIEDETDKIRQQPAIDKAALEGRKIIFFTRAGQDPQTAQCSL